MSKSVYYIETTRNGYIFKRVKICDWQKHLDFADELLFEIDGEKKNYYEHIAGDINELDYFLNNGDHNECKEYEDLLGTRPNIYLEYWLTTELGYYSDRFIGLEIK